MQNCREGKEHYNYRNPFFRNVQVVRYTCTIYSEHSSWISLTSFCMVWLIVKCNICFHSAIINSFFHYSTDHALTLQRWHGLSHDSPYGMLQSHTPILYWPVLAYGEKPMRFRFGQLGQQHSNSEMNHLRYAHVGLAPPETGISCYLLWQFWMLSSLVVPECALNSLLTFVVWI